MAGGLLGGRQNGRHRYRPLAEINVTPLVDVMLVLLIIFMVTAPLMSTAVNIDLPKVNATPINQDSEPLNVSVNAQGQAYLQDSPIELPDLVAKLQAIAQDNKDRRIFVRGDKDNSFGTMLQVMATIIQGGFTKVSLLTDPSGAAPTVSTPTVRTGTTPGAGGAGTSPTTSSAVPQSAVPVSPAPASPLRRQGRG